MPGGGDVVFGGAVKFQLLDRTLPNAPRDFNVLYLGSSSHAARGADARAARTPPAARPSSGTRTASRTAGGTATAGSSSTRPRARLLREADHVVYQSAFCKLGADRFYGQPRGAWEILHNPVDTAAFAPALSRPERPLTLLLGGNQYQRYRVERALETLAIVRREAPGARLARRGRALVRR